MKAVLRKMMMMASLKSRGSNYESISMYITECNGSAVTYRVSSAWLHLVSVI